MKKSRSTKKLDVSASLLETENVDSNPALVPKLRFPGFRKESGWFERHGEFLFDQINERNSNCTFPVLAITQEHGAIPRDMIDFHVSVTDKSIESYKVVRVGDFIISLRSFQGGIEYSRHNGICSPAYVVLRRRIEGSDEYFKHYLKTNRFIQILTRNLEGLRDGKMISYKQFSELLIPIPTTAEQQKIADCLNSLDELIGEQGRKVDALRTHKKGLMQQLFPREGETQPQLRFPEFQDAGDWEEELFRTIYDFMPTNTYSRDKLNYVSGQTKNIHYGDIHTKFQTMFRICRELVPFVNSSESLGTVKADAYCQEGDMVFADASEDLNDVGKSIELVDLNGEMVLSGSHTILARQKGTIFVVGFAGYLFKGRGIRAQIEKESQGTKVLQISPRRLADIKIVFPRNHAEQQRIGSCLSSLDDLITAETQKLEALKTHKRGLMQQMFPSPEEAS